MIYLFYGSDGERARGKWRRVKESFIVKYPDGSIFNFDAEHFDQIQFEELIQGQDLFGGKRLVVADRLLENEEAKNFIEERIKILAESATVFAFLETKLESALIKKIEKAGGKVEELASKTQGFGREGFNLFAVSDALADRDRKRLWILLQEALAQNIAVEEVFWKLVWQVKMLLLVKSAKGQSLKTVKPYVVGKAARGLKNFKDGELEKLSGDLVALWHESKEEGGRDFGVGLERLILNL